MTPSHLSRLHEANTIQLLSHQDEAEDRLRQTIPENTILGDRYQIRRLLREENHATVYEVQFVSNTLAASSDTYEARVFDFRGVQPALERYRRRSMKRLARRSVLKVTWGQFEIVVYKTGDLPPASDVKPNMESDQAGAPTGPAVASTASAIVQMKSAKPKTECQRRWERENQRQRRRHTRWLKTLRRARNEAMLNGTLVEPSLYRSFQILDFQTVPGVSVAIKWKIERWWMVDPAGRIEDLPSYDEAFLQALINLKWHDIWALEQEIFKYEAWEAEWHRFLEDAIRRQFRMLERSPDWHKMQENVINPASVMIEILQNGLMILSNGIEGDEEAIGALHNTIAFHKLDIQELINWMDEVTPKEVLIQASNCWGIDQLWLDLMA